MRPCALSPSSHLTNQLYAELYQSHLSFCACLFQNNLTQGHGFATLIEKSQGALKFMVIGSPDNAGNSQITSKVARLPLKIKSYQDPGRYALKSKLHVLPAAGSVCFIFFCLIPGRLLFSRRCLNSRFKRRLKNEDLPHLPKDSGWEIQ